MINIKTKFINKNIDSQEIINDTESNIISTHPWLIEIIEDLKEKLRN